MRGGEDAHVNPQVVAAAEALDRFFLQHAQQLRLRVEAHVADFVEKDRAAVGMLEAADPPRVSAGESTLLVPEELALQQRLRIARSSPR